MASIRPIEVKVLRPDLQVIAKKGYYPTARRCAALDGEDGAVAVAAPFRQFETGQL